MHKAADRIRNVALVGHRGSGKTSLHEALLFSAEAVNRLGSVVDGSTVSDTDPDEKARQMSISAALSSFQWQDRKVNLLDTPGDSSFVADALGALRVCESAVFVVNAVMGLEVHTSRLWQRADELDISRLCFINMLDRERADFFRALDSLKSAFGQHVGEMTLEPSEDKELFAYVFKTRADPFAGRINLFRVYQGVMKQDSQVLNTRTHTKERIGQLVTFEGNQTGHTSEFGPGDIGAVAKLKETKAGDWLAARDEAIQMPSIKLPAPVMASAIEPKSKGDEDKLFTALRGLQQEDPTT